VRVVALEQSVAGPLCSRILADLGATVVKVERADGDFARKWDSYVKGNSSYFVWLSRRKKSLRLDLHDASDFELLHQLLDDADVLVMNMSAEAADRLGMTEVALRDRFPRLITCHITGYGTKGRSRNRKAYDLLLQAETGLLSLTGDESGPARIGVSIADTGTGLYAAILILGALLQRQSSGGGRFIDLSMFQAMTEFAGPNLTAFANSGVEYERRRLRHHNVVPSSGFWIERLEAAHLAYARINSIKEVWEHAVVSDLDLRSRVNLPDGSSGWVLRSPGETVFGNDEEASVPALDADRAAILASDFFTRPSP